MIKLKNIMLFLVVLVAVFAIVINFNNIKNKNVFFTREEAKSKIVILPGNDYTNKNEFISFIQVTDYVPNNYTDLLNIYYSILNQGWDEFSFHCSENYSTCIDDVKKISGDEDLLADINNYVHPYNTYSSIKTLYDETGEITIKINHLYSKDEIKQIDIYLKQIIDNYTNNEMTDYEKILALHDYIVNSTKYDINKAKNGSTLYDSSRIQGVIFDHYAICSGYSDTMSVILNKLNIPNFRISSTNHVWNAVYLNNQWLHLDLTWDDPVSLSGIDTLSHNYFLIDNIKLKELDNNINEHVFKENIYSEFN